MSNKKKDIVINIEPFHAEIRRFEGGFEWVFEADIKGDNARRKKIKIKCDRWWLSYLANDLKKVLDEEQVELERLKQLCGFKESE